MRREKNRRHRFISLLLLSLCGLSPNVLATGTPGDQPRPVPYNFQYELHVADIFCWIEGRCQGEVGDDMRDMGSAIDRLMSTANDSIDIAIYGLRKQQWFLDRVADLRRRGVALRFTVDQIKGKLGEWRVTENFPYPDVFKLVGIAKDSSVRPDVGPSGAPRAGSVMHNKFLVVDRKTVWLGSTNISNSETGSGYNANSAMAVRSPHLAEIYSREFSQMFDDRLYSTAKSARAGQSLRFADGTVLSVFFSPQDAPIEHAIVPFIRAARKTLNIGMFFLTENRIGDEIIAAKRRGVDVKIILDASGAHHPSSLTEKLRKNGIILRIENWGGKMHMKTAVADGKDVIIGSMNWSNDGGKQNDENTVWIKNSTDLASELNDYFFKLWNVLGEDGQQDYDPTAESLASINSCYDGIDNDHDGMTDADDSGCN